MDTNSRMSELFQQEGYNFMSACFEVHNTLGSGFLEEVYQESLEMELTERGIPFVSKSRLQLYYKDRLLKKYYEADLIVIGEILVELKAVKKLLPEHEAQLINYLKATRKHVGYLVNFCSFPRLEWKRLVH
ncbi:GxxExxY protein [Opitutaceae bacterium TAV4]|nr:GxxExxY protein [Opitutaceae bacterium TAV4]RRJ99504.1 GxxExxY protein [Opitutaceae bacterium TAV3]